VTVRETRAMILRLSPRLDPVEYVFGSGDDPALLTHPAVLGWFREDEGVSLIVEREAAALLGFDVSLPMKRIVCEVNSALDGVGLTAAVAAALAAENIACNVVAAFRHDHLFTPSAQAERALQVLIALAAA
jgi:hypothetical protein